MARYQVVLKANNLTFSSFSTFPQDKLNSQLPSRLIILLHGFPDTYHSFDSVWPILEEKYPGDDNNLILAPSMRGYEPSSVVKDRSSYGIGNTASDVIGWINEIVGDNKIPIHLIGHDWGALTAFKTANLVPELITSICTLAIPYIANLKAWEVLWHCPEQLYLSSYMIRMQTSYLYGSKLYSNALTKEIDSAGNEHNILPYIRGLWKYWSPGLDLSTEDLSIVCTALQKPGVVDATTGYYYSMMKDKRHVKDWVVDFEKVPTLLIGGKDDGCMSHKLYDLEAEKLSGIAQAKVVQVEKVGHFMHRENPTKIAEICIEWIEKYK